MARRSRVRESTTDIETQLIAAIRRDAEIRADTKEVAEDVRDYWRGIAPVRTGAYAASIEVSKARPRDGLPAFRVGTKNWKAHWIEYGTKADPDDSKSPFGPDTPTPAFAPAAKTALRFGGTPDKGIRA